MQTRTFRPTPRNLRFLANRLQADELVAVPSETVYGLAGNGLSTAACARIFAAKSRPKHDPLILHLSSAADAAVLCHWNEAAESVARAFWPGPLTIVLPKRERVPDLATSGLPSVALRVPSHPVLRELLALCQLPLAAPSANPFGYISPTSAQHVRDSLSGRIPYILDGGPCPVGIESTILDLRDPAAPRILRPGIIPAADLSRVLGLPVPAVEGAGQETVAPGMLDKHYSPRTPLEIVAERPVVLAPDSAFVAFTAGPAVDQPHSFVLSPDGQGATAARNLYALLRRLDGSGYRRIQIQAPPADAAHLEALLDRLTRAAKK